MLALGEATNQGGTDLGIVLGDEDAGHARRLTAPKRQAPPRVGKGSDPARRYERLNGALIRSRPSGKYCAMRHRALLVLLWLLTTAAATGVGLLAIHLVGDVLRGSGPVGPAYDSPGSPPQRSPALVIRSTLSVRAATLVVECTGRSAVLVRVTPSDGWRVGETERGPDEDVDVLLRRGGASTWVEVYCNDGAPRAVEY